MSARPPQMVNKLTSGIAKVRANGLASDSAWGLIVEAAQLISSLFIFKLLLSSLGLEGFGDYTALYAIMIPLGTLAASGVALSFMQHAIRENEDLNTVFRSCMSITILLGSMLAVIGVVIASHIVPELPLVSIGAIALLEFIAAPIGQIAAAAVLVRVSYAKAAQVRLIPIVARVIVVAILFALGRLTIQSLAVTFLAISAVIAFITVRVTAQRFQLTGSPGPIQFRHVKSSAVYSVGISGLSLQNDGDKAVLSAYNFRVEGGLYGAAYKIVQFGLLPISTLAASSHQRFLQHTEGDRGQHLRRTIRFAVITGIYGVIVALGLIAISPFLPIFMGEKFKPSVEIVRWLAPLVVLRGLAMFPINGLMGLGKTFARSALLVASAMLSMVLYITLIPGRNWKGAAIGTLIGEAVLAIAAWAMLLYYQRRSNFDTDVAETAELIRRARAAMQETQARVSASQNF
jgi:O-antigen/teichoic acid export membrane protein